MKNHIYKFMMILLVACVFISCDGASDTNLYEGLYGGNDGTYYGGDGFVPVDGVLAGEFSVAKGKKVHFSKGNLCNINGWRFEERQYDCSHNYGFAWSTPATYYGMENSTNPDYYLGNFKDWGENAIANGGTARTYRTLTASEWNYLFNERVDAADKAGYATVCDMHGIILLPDEFTDPMKNNGSGAFVPKRITGWRANVYNFDNWEEMEQAGAVFLPAAGDRTGSRWCDFGELGRYWSATASSDRSAYYLDFRSFSVNAYAYVGRSLGCAVRLVCEVN